MFKLLPNYKSANVNFLDDPTGLTDLALCALGKKIGTTNPGDIAAATQLLVTAKPYVKTIGADAVALGSRGLIDICLGYNGDAYVVAKARAKHNDPIIFMLPQPTGHDPGYTEFFIDKWWIPTVAQNPRAAHAWINYMLDPVVGASEMNFIGYLVPVKGIEKYADKSLINNPGINIPAKDLVHYQSAPFSAKYIQLATQAYNKFKAA